MTGQIHESAELMLAYIRAVNEQVAGMEARAEEEMERVRERYEGPLAEARDKQRQAEKDLVALMKENRGVLFDGTDQVDLKTGVLLHGEKDRVKIPRDAVERIEAQGWEEALKRAVSVDRGVVEKWPDERLIMIGAERKTVEVFDYELKNPKNKGGAL